MSAPHVIEPGEDADFDVSRAAFAYVTGGRLDVSREPATLRRETEVPAVVELAFDGTVPEIAGYEAVDGRHSLTRGITQIPVPVGAESFTVTNHADHAVTVELEPR